MAEPENNRPDDPATGPDAAAPQTAVAKATAPADAASAPSGEAAAPVASARAPLPPPSGILDGMERPAPDALRQWYVVHTYSGFENKAKQALEERIRRERMDGFFGKVLIPTEEVVEMKQGTRRTSKRKFFPGYMLVEMAMSEATWYLVKSTPKVTGFVGGTTRPVPITEAEVQRLTNQITEGTERVKPKVIFDRGDSVRVIDGPFSNFNGVIDEVDQERGKLRVLVSIFGRATPVEMDFTQVERT